MAYSRAEIQYQAEKLQFPNILMQQPLMTAWGHP